MDEIVTDSQLAESWTIVRSVGGSFGPGGFSSGTKSIPAFGTTTKASDKEMSMLPEGDQVGEGRFFYTNIALLTTQASTTSIADIIQWNGDNYRVMKVQQTNNRAFWRALAVRMAGS